jgi:hypothetical protein
MKENGEVHLPANQQINFEAAIFFKKAKKFLVKK